MNPPKNIARNKKGQWGEWYALLYLRMTGWRIIEHNWRCRGGEIDIIARRGRLLAVIEVKNHAFYDDAQGAVSHRQQRRIIHATRVFLAFHHHYASHDIRFDVILLRQWWRLIHIKNAWVSS